MIRPYIRNISILFFIAAALSGSFYLSSHLQSIPVKMVNEPAYADGFMEDVVAIRMNENGTPKSTLYSPKLVHFAQNNSTRLTSPHFVILPNIGNSWDIYANHGVSDNGVKTLYLWGEVKLHQAKGRYNKETTILTTSLTVYPEENTAKTDQAVQLIQNDSTINATGLKTNFKTSTIELLSESRGVYDPGH